MSTGAQMRTTEDKIRREIAIMKKCHHLNVVRLKEVIDDPHNKRIFLSKLSCVVSDGASCADALCWQFWSLWRAER